MNEAKTEFRPWIALTLFLIDKYDLSNDYKVVMVGNELEEIECAGTDISEIVQQYENDGFFREFAIEKAVENRVTISAAPNNFTFVRLCANNKKPLTVMINKSDMTGERTMISSNI